MGEDEYGERLKESINNFIFCNGSPFMTLGEAEDLAIEMHSKFMAIHRSKLRVKVDVKTGALNKITA